MWNPVLQIEMNGLIILYQLVHPSPLIGGAGRRRREGVVEEGGGAGGGSGGLPREASAGRCHF